MATQSDCVIYLNWYEFLKEVADGAGIAVPSGLVSQISQARGYFEVGRYEEAYSMSSAAVRDFRALLKGQREQFRARCDALVGSINATLSGAQRDGIDVGAFTNPFNAALAIYGGEDFIGSFYSLNGLAEDLSNYVSNARMGRYVSTMAGAYNVPDGTTDIIVIDRLQVESAGWAYVSEQDMREILMPLVRQAGGEEILEVRFAGPRITIFVKGSPILDIIFAFVLLISIVLAVTYAVVQIFAGPAIEHEKQEGELARRKAEIQDSYNRYIAEKVQSGELSPEVGKQLMDENSENLQNIQLPEGGWGITDYIKLGVGIAVVGVALYFTVPLLKGAFKKGERKEREVILAQIPRV